jgi:hypothetical protein
MSKQGNRSAGRRRKDQIGSYEAVEQAIDASKNAKSRPWDRFATDSAFRSPGKGHDPGDRGVPEIEKR